METTPNIEVGQITPLGAFAEAVSVAYSANINAHLRENPVSPPKFLRRRFLDKTLTEASSGVCEKSSIDAAYMLTTRFPEVYDKLFLVTSYDLPQSSAISKMVVGRKGVLFYHTYVIMKGKDNFWYAASPGNHNSKKSESYALKIIREPSIDKTLAYIQKRDGGSWPDPNEAMADLNGPEYKNPTANPHDKSLSVFNIEKGNSIKQFMFTFSVRVQDQ